MSIDIVMFVLLVAIAGIGFLMKFVVVPGEVRNQIYGNNVELEFYGMTRHEWGHIHLIISLVFLSFLVLHIIFHWKLIVSIFRCMFPARFVRYTITGMICLIGLVTLISPFMLQPELIPAEPNYRNRTNHIPSQEIMEPESLETETSSPSPSVEPTAAYPAPEILQDAGTVTREDHHNSEYSEFEVYGSQTLREVADRYGVPAEVIARDLNIPENLSGEKLGHLRKRYSFTMTDVRKSIYDYKKQSE